MSGYQLLLEVVDPRSLEWWHGARTVDVVAQAVFTRVRALSGLSPAIKCVDSKRFVLSWTATDVSREVTPVDLFDAVRAALVDESPCDSDATERAYRTKLSLRWLEGRKKVGLSCSVPCVLHVESPMELGITAHVRDAIEHGSLVHSFQPVCRVDDADDVMYYACVPYLARKGGRWAEVPDNVRPVLEQFTFVRYVERYLAKQALTQLKARVNLCVGISISAQSAVMDDWWQPIFSDLARSPQVARRFFIEVAESAPLIKGVSRHLIQRLKQLGCQIVIDDFGVKYGTETGMEINAPDVIKIGASWLDRMSTASDEQRFADMVRLAKSLAPAVVIKGVAHIDHYEAVRRVGGHWVQPTVTTLRSLSCQAGAD
ncbi:hypothetical protein WJ36_09750 [Burkholderia ubonensis]|uniref:EAL domain-containing protein n=1 Tax=Burkholderia ubonensis TaxID=101571 RepID=UPI000755AA81|nr:EAL domain-containing protein [Burkholderia ubonensis]KVG83448.1 hypothetical protein WJ36_09750 [Burkholderia ubonensis]